MKSKRFKAVVFDLDDTLYPEYQFVFGGYLAVANYIRKLYGIEIYEELARRYRSGEDGPVRHSPSGDGGSDPFTPVLRRYFRTIEPLLIQRLRDIHRCHAPRLSLFSDARTAIALLGAQGYKIGLMTDGYSCIQKNKVEKLELKALLDSLVFADDLGGEDFWKPSPDPFHIMALQLEVETREMVYVGDDPTLDFLAPRQLDMGAVRVLRPDSRHEHSRPPTPAHEPELTIPSLSLLPEALHRLEESLSHPDVPSQPLLTWTDGHRG
ncbi:MAG: HAD family hydrolase [Lentisphaerae bacterium]|nr:HAD family hydrolase [Lentisphaerota bacterium]